MKPAIAALQANIDGLVKPVVIPPAPDALALLGAANLALESAEKRIVSLTGKVESNNARIATFVAGQAALDLALVSAHRALEDAIASKQAALVAVGAQEPVPGPAAPASPPCSGASDATLRAQVEVTFLKFRSSVVTSDLQQRHPN